MAGYKLFADGVPLYASELNDFLMKQTVMRFATTTALTNALGAGVREVGMCAWADNTGILYMWDGTNWIPMASPEKTFAPVFTAGGTPITFGNALTNSWWRYSGGMVRWNYRFVVGGTSNMQAGNYALSLPVSARTEHDWHMLGPVSFKDDSTGTVYTRHAVTLGSISSFGIVDQSGTRLSPAVPIAAAINDQFGISLTYPPNTSTYL